MSIKTAIIDEAISILKITGSRKEARATLLAGMNRYPLKLFEQVAIAGTYKILESEIPFKIDGCDNLGRHLTHWEQIK